MNDSTMIESDTMDTDMMITPTTSYPNQSNNIIHSNNNDLSSKPIQPPPLPHLTARSRNDSLISVDTTYTVYTNVEQTQLNNYNNNFNSNINNPHLNFNRNRQDSNASLNSSVFSEMPPPQLDNYNFTTQFDDELYSYYIAYSQQPNITPFDIRYPPSGILSLISKLFLENNILNGNKIQIDSRFDINNDLLLDSNRHKCLAIIRLRLIQLCNINLISNDDQFNFNDQLPITRTNSIASAISLGDRVIIPSVSMSMPLSANSNTDLSSQYNVVPPPMVHRPSWLHMPNLYSKNLKDNNNNNNNSAFIPSSTDSLIDRVPSILSNPINNSNNIPSNFNQLDDDSSDQSIQNDIPSSLTSNNNKRERPSLNLHMPSFLKYRSINNSMPPRPLFSTGPVTPNTPNTPVGNSSQRAPRNARSGSSSNLSNSYFNLNLSSNNNNINNNSNGNNRQFSNPTLNHLNGNLNLELQSPYEQAFPSPLTFNPPIALSTNNNNNNNNESSPLGNSTPIHTPTTPAGTTELFNVTSSRKRDSLKLKRGLN